MNELLLNTLENLKIFSQCRRSSMNRFFSLFNGKTQNVVNAAPRQEIQEEIVIEQNDYVKQINVDWKERLQSIKEKKGDLNMKDAHDRQTEITLSLRYTIYNEFMKYMIETFQNLTTETEYDQLNQFIFDNLYLVNNQLVLLNETIYDHDQYNDSFEYKIRYLYQKLYTVNRILKETENVQSFYNYLLDLSCIIQFDIGVDIKLESFLRYRLYNNTLDYLNWKESQNTQNLRMNNWDDWSIDDKQAYNFINTKLAFPYESKYYGICDSEEDFINARISWQNNTTQNGSKSKRKKAASKKAPTASKEVKSSKSTTKYTKSTTHHKIGSRKYCIYLGPRGGKYIRKDKQYINIRKL